MQLTAERIKPAAYCNCNRDIPLLCITQPQTLYMHRVKRFFLPPHSKVLT